MKKISSKNKGFTMVELLGAIVILGILSVVAIAGVTKILEHAKTEYYKTTEKDFKLAAQSFVQNNRNYLPKRVGQSTKIKLSTLKGEKYIASVKDYSKKECDEENSYVKIFKYSKDSYSYLPYLECPTYRSDDTIKDISPKVEIVFSKVGNDTDTDKTNFKDAKAEITITGNKGARANQNIKLLGYNYIVYRNGKEIINSGSVDAKYATTIKKTLNLTKYTPGKITIKVTATNIYGLTETVTKSTNYKDIEPPVCGKITGDSTTWIKDGERKITVACSDGNGIGCTRTEYTKVFRNETKVGYIKIEDESGNTTDCPVNVYIDKTKPTLTINAYERTSSGGKTGGIIATKTVNNSTPAATMNTYTNSHNSWLNKANYPYGIYYEIKYSDNVANVSGEWKYNDSGLTEEVGKNSSVSNGTATDIGSIKGEGDEFLSADGYRKAYYKISDEAGNSVQLNIVAPIDKKAPVTPSITNPTNGNWTKDNFSLTLSSSDAVSGLDRFRYKYTGAWTDYANSAYSPFVTTPFSAERNEPVYISACDKAGNCSSDTNNSNTYIRIDKTKPTCIFSGENSSWRTANVTVTATCKDGTGSGCTSDTSSYSWPYTSGTHSTEYTSYTIRDNAGNSATCSKTSNIYLDKEAPSAPTSPNSISVSGTNTTGTVGTADGSKDSGSDLKEYRYLIKNSSSTPSNTDSGFTTSRNFYRSCGKSYYAWAIAIDNVGNRSGVKYLGFTSDGIDSYTAWNSCSRACGGGTQYRSNSCALVTTGLSQSCNTQGCCSSVSYRDGSTCSKKCGSGTYNQLAYSDYDGSRCSSYDKSSGGSSCNTQSCCSKVTYQNGSSCSKKCGSGTYNQLAYSDYDGSRCSSYDTSSGGSSCNTQSCCSRLNYSEGSTCSKKCGGGSYNRLAYSYYDGSRCSGYDESSGGSSCNTQGCCSKLTYKEGSTCSKKCGGGTYNRLAYSYYDDSRCSSYDQTSGGSSCNTHTCVKPTCSISLSGTKGSNSWYVSSVDVTLNTTGSPTKVGLSTNENYAKTNGRTTDNWNGDKAEVIYYGYVENENGSNPCTIKFKVDKTAPTEPTSGVIGTAQGTTSPASFRDDAAGSTDATSGVASYLYCVKRNTSTKPSKNDSCFSSSKSYTRKCNDHYYAWTIAVDKAGNRSAVHDARNYTDTNMCNTSKTMYTCRYGDPNCSSGSDIGYTAWHPSKSLSAYGGEYRSGTAVTVEDTGDGWWKVVGKEQYFKSGCLNSTGSCCKASQCPG